MPHRKICTLDELEALSTNEKSLSQRFVLSYGQFDTLHIGHLRHLTQAKALGDKLVVVLATDDCKSTPGLPEKFRAQALAHLDTVDVVCVSACSLREVLSRWRPAVCTAMHENNGSMTLEAAAALCAEQGIEFVETNGNDFNSTGSINRFFSNFSQETYAYLEQFESRYSCAEVMQYLDDMSSLKVAVIGDTIIDSYTYCSPLGASSKDPILALQYKSNDIFAGGILAVANHVANFAGQVKVFTVLGDQDNYRPFIESALSPRIRTHFAIQEGAPTVCKLRYLDGYTQNKILEIYQMDDAGLPPEVDAEFREAIAAELKDFDMVLVADFGHGAVSPALRTLLTEQAGFLAVNAQANSGNRGFHTISRYARADYVSIAEHELRLEARDIRGSARAIIDGLAPKLDCDSFVVTRGKRGSLIRSADGTHIEVPAFATKVVDRIGAGDAFLSVTSMAAKLGAPPEVTCFVGNVVGALAVEILGNQKSIDKEAVKRYISTLFE